MLKPYIKINSLMKSWMPAAERPGSPVRAIAHPGFFLVKNMTRMARNLCFNEIYEYKYVKVETALRECIYCGDPAEAWHHIPPFSIAEQFYGAFIKVPACCECNSALGYKRLLTIDAGKEFLFKRYTRKYKAILRIPDWDKYEHAEIAKDLSKFIKNGTKECDHLKIRLDCLTNNDLYIKKYEITERSWALTPA